MFSVIFSIFGPSYGPFFKFWAFETVADSELNEEQFLCEAINVVGCY
ncbi:MAG: hypothetical protein HUU28_17740 [Planctomycetaceae bacterium]|nr:hypothetical protein [Planctomycetaceae bacterium]